jgi:hypothetical protein
MIMSWEELLKRDKEGIKSQKHMIKELYPKRKIKAVNLKRKGKT